VNVCDITIDSVPPASLTGAALKDWKLVQSLLGQLICET
jgi:hypothetical protein